MKRKIEIIIVLIIVISTALSIQYIVDAVQYVQYIRSGINAFPTDYQVKLNEIAKEHPNWNFQAYYTGISWDTLIEKERDESIHRNRVIATSDLSWKNNCNFEENGYACASDEIVAYYLDPRNFLNEKNIFQFVESSYNSDTQTLEVIQKSVKGTFLDSTITCKDNEDNDITMSYSQIIIEAAKQSNISAFYIKSKIIQEVGVQGSDSVKGNYVGYEGYYNFYNYGASDTGNPIENGLKFAKENQWDSQYKAIVNGAKLIGKKYIEAGQNTAYFNKWDVVGTKILKDGETQSVQEKDLFWHQYMTNIQDPTNQSYSNYKLYADNLDGNITFIIPVYNNMPESTKKPTDVKLNSIYLNTTEMNLQVGTEASAKTGYISVVYNPGNVTDKVLYWESSNNKVATVNEGNVTAVGEGTAIITAKSRDGNKTANCKVNVIKIDKALRAITMNTNKISLNVGETGWVGVTYNPSDASDKVLYWSSSDESVAKVNEGVITAIGRGTVMLTATSRDGGKTATCEVTVTDPNYKELKSIKMNQETVILKKGENGWIGVTYNPSDASDKVLYWSSSDESVAKVNEGVVTAIGEGKAILTATARAGGKTASCTVTVENPNFVHIDEIKMKTEELNLNKGENGWVGVTYSPSNASNKVLTWKSSNEEVVTVREGNVKAVGEGKAVLTATSEDGGKTTSCIVTVVDPKFVHIDEIKMKTEELNLNKGENGWIGVTYNPSNASNKVLTWKSSNGDVAIVREGNVKAVGEGTAILTATSEDGGKTASCKVIVTGGKKHLENIALKTTTLEMKPGEGKTIYVEYNPSDVEDKVLYWTSNNEKVVTVREGYVKAVGEGTTTITATSRDGNKTATCKITVSDGTVKLQNIKLSSSTEILKKGEQKTIYVTYNPSNVTDKTLYWTSSDEKVATIREGFVKAIGDGVATLTATSRDGEKKVSCQVVVINKSQEIESISLKTTKETIEKGEEKTIYAVYNPSDVKDKTLYWISSNTSVVTVEKGRVKAVGKGTATITAVSRDGGKTASCEITVK